MIPSVWNWDFWSPFKCLGSFLGDIFRHAFWQFISFLGSVCDSIYSVVNFIMSSEGAEIFTKNSVVSRFFVASYFIAFFCLVLVFIYNEIQIMTSPENNKSQFSILFEFGKCGVLIALWLIIFNTSWDLVSEFEKAIPNIYSNTKLTESSNNINEDKVFSSTIIASFISLPTEGEDKNFTQSDLIAALGRRKGYCEDGISFWGCTYRNYNKFDRVDLYFDRNSKNKYNINLKDIDEDNRTVVPMYNWRGSIQKSLLHGAEYNDEYLFSTDIGSNILLIICLLLFGIAIFFMAFSLVTRLFDLIILLIIAPVVIAFSLGNPNQRSTIYRALSGLLLQSVGTLLILYLSMSFTQTISTMSMPAQFNMFTFLLLKCVLIVGLAYFLGKGSRMINTFISDSAGISNGIAGGLITVAGAYGIGKGVATVGGSVLKAPSGMRSVKDAFNTSRAKRQLNKAESAYKSNPNGMAKDKKGNTITDTEGNPLSIKQRYADAAENYNTAVSQSKNHFNDKGELKRGGKDGFINKMSVLGDRMQGNKNGNSLESKHSYNQRKASEAMQTVKSFSRNIPTNIESTGSETSQKTPIGMPKGVANLKLNNTAINNTKQNGQLKLVDRKKVNTVKNSQKGDVKK